MDEAYADAHRALEGFERVVMRWPDAATQLERVLADADRLLLNRVGAFADESGGGNHHGSHHTGGGGGLFRAYGGVGASADPGRSGLHGHRGVRESARFTGHNLQRPPLSAYGGGAQNGSTARNAGGGRTHHHARMDAVSEESEARAPAASPAPKATTVHGALHRLRAGKAAAAAAMRQARHAAESARRGFGVGSTKAKFGASGGAEWGVAGCAEDGYVPAELAAALTALKSMEVLRPEVNQRLAQWVDAAGGGRRAAGEEFGRRSSEVLGELRAQYAALLRRAVAGVASAGPSLLGVLRRAALDGPSAFDAKSRQELGARRRAASPGREGVGGGGSDDADDVHGSDDRAMEDGGSAEAATRDELDAVVAPVLRHVDVVVLGLRRTIPQRRALVGVLRGMWDRYGAEALKFVEEDLRQKSSWRLRLMATGASERVSAAVSGAIRDALGHDVKEKDLEPPAPVKKLADFVGGTAEESVSVY